MTVTTSISTGSRTNVTGSRGLTPTSKLEAETAERNRP
jgi:hypothetical protein